MKRLFPILVVITLAISTLACSYGTLQYPLLSEPAVKEPTATTAAGATAASPSVIVSGSVTELDATLSSLYERVSPGVVAIQASDETGSSLGSGFVYDTEGHIVTNYHVVAEATDLEVDFPNGFKAYAELVATDLDSDIAVIKVDAPAEELTPLPLGDSDQVKIGQMVVAIGNPFGYYGTMTVGFVSAKGRTLSTERDYYNENGYSFSAGDIIQTDAAINPGNSGGPLLNLSGEIIGINRAIETTSTTTSGEPTNSGIGFAISSNIVRRVVPVLISDGKYDYPYLGISSRSEMSLSEYQALDLPVTYGAYVIEVTKDGPAEQAGIIGDKGLLGNTGLTKGGDLIIAMDGQPVRVFDDIIGYLMANKSPGDSIVLTIIRDNEEKEVTVILGKRP